MSANTTYDQGYDAGWNGKLASENPYLAGSEAVGEIKTQDAVDWENGRFDGRNDKRAD